MTKEEQYREMSKNVIKQFEAISKELQMMHDFYHGLIEQMEGNSDNPCAGDVAQAVETQAANAQSAQ